ncbi:MAG TPA: TIM barrel protein [Hypericibacter adhaerens]|jgi:sugar phosphate isomerase/epimerase|uniref:sugar phosphate isomerase/epimerase family protein n=1 Tax=Hypericibacter adhaerens TaxID=2602016 RepID=UPI002B71F084|nr:TIM barrel protein [Hypericibacter adhaerens]HWA44622.1 TIM barrel protein [Hypericibacter adhaerens]
MDRDAEAGLKTMLSHNVAPGVSPPRITAAAAERLLERTANPPFFAHSYSFYHNMMHGFSPQDLARFAYEHDLQGVCLHISDGEASSVRRMTPVQRAGFRALLEELGLRLHLEISSTDRKEIDTVVECARSLGAKNLRLYARHEGPLSAVIEKVYRDLAYACECANRYDLQFDYEQHEDLRAGEIAAILARLGDPRMKALFDYSNSLNAYEEPLEALHILAPHIRQAHVKGARKIVEGDGWGQLGVPQGSADDELPGARMLYDLLMLGEREPQVICFALEQEVDYYAPAFRKAGGPADPVIQYREPSETPVDRNKSRDRLLSDERRWAVQQIAWNRSLVASFRALARRMAPERSETERSETDWPRVASLPQAAYGRVV